ncbi:cold shock domain-containing protein [Streptomyces sp. H27-H1]|uniref:cold-shock protein n=1 Tax=Streptomyces sp. H27-H1 TaxID=2996461 RepID=UPI00226DBACE|nr:cold shock domain-containing protein [Streptomyces sp. H27-H1]MCY0931636.1 cold shock domain-containing protein [Streptomyces sp. H27-H1]
MAETCGRSASGTVLWRAPCGEFSLITPDGEGEADLFVHRSDMAAQPLGGTPGEGDAVVYELCADVGGPSARNVRRSG